MPPGEREEAPAEAIGLLDTETVALSTCGGEWSVGMAEPNAPDWSPRYGNGLS
ncbi:MAG: hypothetical protein ACR2GS_12680 [Thermomicrobiales bacterium]